MRLASLLSKPGHPVSIKSDWPDGLTISVDCPPSTSMKKICKAFVFAEAEVEQIKARISGVSKNRKLMCLIGNPCADILLGFLKTHNRVPRPSSAWAGILEY